MNRNIVAAILLLEGLASAALQMLAIRQVTGYVGSSILVTSIVISTFLAALALGYWRGGKSQAGNYRDVLVRNLVIAIGIFGIGLSYPVVDVLFSVLDGLTNGMPVIGHPLFHLFVFSGLILAPLVFILAQTVPLLLHTAKSETSKSEATGNLTALSTLGNVFGGLITALVFLTLFGVGSSILLNSAVLFLSLLLAIEIRNRSHWIGIAMSVAFLSIATVLNVAVERELFQVTTPYANIKIIQYGNEAGGKAMLVNDQFASYTDDENRAWPYVEIMRTALKSMEPSEVLVLGAGGFTLSTDEELHKHKFTYVDIDEKLLSVAENHFLGHKVFGDVVSEDARAYLLARERLVDVIVIDLFSSGVMVPAHTATTEFFHLVKSRLKDSGLVMINIAANPMLNDDYSARIDKTIRSSLSRCVTDLSSFRDGLVSLVYFCHGGEKRSVQVYRDDHEGVSIDAFLLANMKDER